MRCGYLALLLVAVFVTADRANPAEHTTGHLVVQVKGGSLAHSIVSNRTAHIYAARSGAGAAYR
jgi:hypothetical protein